MNIGSNLHETYCGQWKKLVQLERRILVGEQNRAQNGLESPEMDLRFSGKE